MWLDIISELCCDYCNEIIHNHFVCPVCKDEYASTDIYGNMYDFVTEPGDYFFCEECQTKFILVSGSPYNGDWEIDTQILE